MMQLKKTEIKIITNLREDGRMPLTELSRKIKLPVSTIHDRLKSTIDAGIIKPTVLINFEKIGFSTRAHILLTVEPAEKETLLAYLKEHPNVNALYKINNGWSLLMECIFKDMPLLENFVEKIEQKFHIKQKQVHYVLEELKREEFLNKPDQAEKTLTG